MAVQPIVVAIHPPSMAEVVGLSPLAVAGFDRTLACTGANLRFLDLTGRGEHQVEGLQLGTLLPQLSERDLAVAARILAGSIPEAVFTVRIDAGQQQERWRIHVYAIVRHGDTTGLGLLAEEVVEDRPETEQQREEEALELS